ncbi:MAG: ABC transporter ATP-binding protein [Ethanoligenens sp.]
MPSEIHPNFTGRPTGSRFMGEKEELRDIRGTLRRLLAYLAEKKGILVLVFGCAAATTIFSIVGTRLSGYAVDRFIAEKDIRGLAFLCLVLLGMYLVSVVSTYAQNILMIGVAQRTSAHIRRDLFSNLQKLPVRYFDTHASGDLMSRLTNDVDNINITLSQGVVQLFSGVVNVAGMLTAMFLLSPLLTGIALLMMPWMFLGTKWIAQRTQPHFVTQQRELGKLNSYVEEMVSGQKIVKLFSREREVEATFSALNHQLSKSATTAQAFSGLMGPLNNIVNNLTYMVITVCGSIFVIHGMFGVTVGMMFAFLLYMRNFTRPINDILNLFNTVQLALAGAERVFEVIDEEAENDSPHVQELCHTGGHVAFKQVDFSYISDKPILQGISIQANKGQTIALVGPTGAGKSTIISLLTRFYDCDAGHILLDGKDINGFSRQSLRSSVSVVLQDPFLFSETVRENIRYGRLTATDEEVEKAAKQAYAHDFITRLPDGYDTSLSDNGCNLSQGQRQLLSIARAMIARSTILILDEATSSIDTRTEADIQKALLTLMRGKTSFVIAHRLSTIRRADRILVIRDGRITESGTHDALLEQDGFYAQLYNSQFAEKNDA